VRAAGEGSDNEDGAGGNAPSIALIVGVVVPVVVVATAVGAWMHRRSKTRTIETVFDVEVNPERDSLVAPSVVTHSGLRSPTQFTSPLRRSQGLIDGKEDGNITPTRSSPTPTSAKAPVEVAV